MTKLPQIVIVGGGAGGFELATLLGKKLGKKKQAKITLIDSHSTHLWKPLLHEVAAGTLDANQDEINFFVHANKHHYFFQLGEMIGLNRQKKEIKLAPIRNEKDEEIIPTRDIHYDILVLAFGSITNDFGIPGVKEYGLFLDNREQADQFQQLFLKHMLRLQSQNKNHHVEKLHIVIVGGGATGVELAAELHFTLEQAVTYGLDQIVPEKDVDISLIEAAPRVLANLPERISTLTTRKLEQIGVTVLTNEKVKEVRENEIITANGHIFPATIVVWTGGIKIADFANRLDGLAVNHLNQICVRDSLQTTLDDHIFAMGDCASCPLEDHKIVPPRAQAAHQQAKLLAKSLPRFLENKPLLKYHYHDYGSLISLSQYTTLGNLMGKLTGSILLEGKIARFVYLSLYKKHQIVLQGLWRVMLLTLANLLTRRVKPKLKLH